MEHKRLCEFHVIQYRSTPLSASITYVERRTPYTPLQSYAIIMHMSVRIEILSPIYAYSACPLSVRKLSMHNVTG